MKNKTNKKKSAKKHSRRYNEEFVKGLKEDIFNFKEGRRIE